MERRMVEEKPWFSMPGQVDLKGHPVEERK
jgi:hypothetical protein